MKYSDFINIYKERPIYRVERRPKSRKQFGYLYYRALENNSYRHGNNLDAIPLSCFSNYLSECEVEHQKLTIVLWALGKKIEEYEDSSIPYCIYELEHMINAVFFKENIEINSIFTICGYIKTLVNLDIILEENKTHFMHFAKHKRNWDKRENILKKYIESKVEDFLEDKKIIGELPEYLACFNESFKELEHKNKQRHLDSYSYSNLEGAYD